MNANPIPADTLGVSKISAIQLFDLTELTVPADRKA